MPATRPQDTDAFSQLGQDLSDSLRQEFEELRAHAGERARAGAKGTALLAAAGAAGTIAAMSALARPILALRRVLSPATTAIVVCSGAGMLTLYLVKRGLDELGLDTDAATQRVKDSVQSG